MKIHEERECSECGKSFETYNLLRTHLVEHKTQNQFKCDDCDQSFNLQCRFNEHRKLHMNLENREFFSCTHCPR